jgi:hypothetical protein
MLILVSEPLISFTHSHSTKYQYKPTPKCNPIILWSDTFLLSCNEKAKSRIYPRANWWNYLGLTVSIRVLEKLIVAQPVEEFQDGKLPRIISKETTKHLAECHIFVMRGYLSAAKRKSCKITNCRLSAIIYPIQSQLTSVSAVRLILPEPDDVSWSS